jgi:hypothetical protein
MYFIHRSLFGGGGTICKIGAWNIPLYTTTTIIIIATTKTATINSFQSSVASSASYGGISANDE